MEAFEVYKLYVALKTHFTSDSFNYFKYNGKIRARRDSFEKRRDRSFFHVIGKRYPTKEELEMFFVANFIENGALWIGDAVAEQASKVYTEHKTRIESLMYSFRRDVDVIKEAMDEYDLTPATLHKVPKGMSYPLLVTLYNRREISIETVLIYHLADDTFTTWDATVKETMIYPQVRQRCLKYLPFIESRITDKKFSQYLSDSKSEPNFFSDFDEKVVPNS